MPPCPAECGYDGVSLRHHFYHSPHCVPAVDIAPPEAKRRRDPAKAAQLFSNRFTGAMGKAMMRMHVDQYMDISDLELVRNLVLVTAELTVEFIESELQSADQSLFERARSALKKLPSARTMVDQRRKIFLRAEPRHLSTHAGADKKGACFFSVVNLDAVKAESEEAGWAYDVEAIAHRSPGGLAAALVQLQETPQAVRSIVSVTRGRDEVCRGDWIVVRQVGMDPIAGEVQEMMQCIAPGSAFSFIRMWCTNCKPLREDELSGVMYALSAASAGRMLVRFECMQVEAVVRSVRSGREEFV